MNEHPSKEEILSMFRDLIGGEDFEVIYKEKFPTPKETHQENAWMKFLGYVGEFPVFWKNVGGKVFAAVVLIGSLDSGIGAISKYSKYGYDQIAQFVDLGASNCENPADEFVIFEPPEDWPEQDDRSIYLTSTTTTTTTTPPPEPPTIELPPGSGIAPNSSGWTT